MSEISFTAPKPSSSGDKVRPTVAPEPVKAAPPAKQPKADKYKPYDKL